MLRFLAVFIVYLGILCLAQSNAQVPMTGAGLGSPTVAATYTGPSDCSGCATGATFFGSVRGYSAAYASGSNKTFTTVTRTIDSHTCDFLIATNGNIGNTTNCSTGGDNGSTAASWCAATTCEILTAVDQSGSGNNATDATTARQPIINLSTSPFTGFSTSFTFIAGGGGGSSYWDAGAFNGSTFTWIFWVKTSSIAQTGIVGTGLSSTPILRLDASGKIELLNNSAASLCTSTGTINTGWHQVAVTWDNGTGICKLYIDGSLDSSTTTGAQTFGSQTNFYIGSPFAEQPFDGQMAEMMAYNSVLTATQITNIFNNATSNP